MAVGANGFDEGAQLYEALPSWAPRPEHRPNGRPQITMVQFLDRMTRPGSTMAR